MDKVIDSISGSVPIPDSEYLGEDGLLHCKVCNKAVQTAVEFMGMKKIVRCICECKQKEQERHMEEEKRQEKDRQRRVCFAETNMASWTFQNDDRRNPKLSDAMMRYADSFADFKKESRGLLLHGGCGTGKTFFAACIANRLIDDGYKVLMTNFAQLINRMQGMFEGKQEFIGSLNRYSLLVIDDLGIERKTDSGVMQEIIFNVIDSRYRSGLPFIITTNLTKDELVKSNDIRYSRIYDRILERCFPIEVSGGSRRRQRLKDSFADTKARLGL